MKVILDLEKYTVEYLETTPFIQGTDSRNKIEVLVPHESTTDVMIAYTLASGRSTIAMANKSLTTITYNSASYDNVLFELPSTVTRLEGNICATVIVTLASDSTKHKFNILNTILNSTDFETFEDALTGIAAQVLASLAAMNSNLSSMSTNLNNHTGNTNNPHSVTKEQLELGNVTNDRQMKAAPSSEANHFVMFSGTDGATTKDGYFTYTNTILNSHDANQYKLPTEKAVRTELDKLQDEINDLGEIAEMPDKIIDVANCFDFTNDEAKVSVDEVGTPKIGNSKNSNKNTIEFGEGYGYNNFTFKTTDGTNTDTLTLQDIVEMSHGKTSNYVIDANISSTSDVTYVNTQFKSTSESLIVPVVENQTKLFVEGSGAVYLSDIETGDIISIKQSDYPDRWAAIVANDHIVFLPFEIKLTTTLTNAGANANFAPTSATVYNALSGKQATIDSSHKLDADLVDDTNSTNKFVNADEKANITKGIYHLGAFDSVSGNVITRQTGYVDLGSLSWSQSNTRYVADASSLPIGEVLDPSVVANIKCSIYTTLSANDTYLGQTGISQDHYNFYIYDANFDFSKLKGVILQYKLATSYTETIIENQPLNTLDQKGSEWLRNEWEKGLNLLNPNAKSYVNAYNICIGFAYLENGKTYSILVPTNTESSMQLYRRNMDGTSGETVIGQISNYKGTFVSNATGYFQIWLNPTSGQLSWLDYDYMLTESDHAYPYQAYNGAIVHEKDITPVLLWENGNPNSSLSSGTITTLDMSKFKYIVFEYKVYKTFVGTQTIKVKYAIGDSGSMTYIASSYIGRNIYIASSTTITFSSAYENGTANDDFIIPIAIYGTNVL